MTQANSTHFLRKMQTLPYQHYSTILLKNITSFNCRIILQSQITNITFSVGIIAKLSIVIVVFSLSLRQSIVEHINCRIWEFINDCVDCFSMMVIVLNCWIILNLPLLIRMNSQNWKFNNWILKIIKKWYMNVEMSCFYIFFLVIFLYLTCQNK